MEHQAIKSRSRRRPRFRNEHATIVDVCFSVCPRIFIGQGPKRLKFTNCCRKIAEDAFDDGHDFLYFCDWHWECSKCKFKNREFSE
jgi:hypothetical protein